MPFLFYAFCICIFIHGQFLFFQKTPDVIMGSVLSFLAVGSAFLRKANVIHEGMIFKGAEWLWKNRLRQNVPVRGKKTESKFSPVDFFTWQTAGAFCAYSIFTISMLWQPLTHLNDILGTQDIVQFYPHKFMWVESVKAGNPAFWNPYSNLGNPFLAMPSVGVYTPFNWLYFIVPVSYAFTLDYLFHFLIAALGTYYFVRQLGTGWMGAFLSGLAFGFSSFFICHMWAGHPNIVRTGAWLPWVLVCLRFFVHQKKYSRLALASACMGFCNLEGVPQISFYFFLFCGCYLIWEWWERNISFIRLFLANSLLFAGSILLSACQVIPMYELVRLSNRWDWSYSYNMVDYLYPQMLFFFINPFFLGNPITNVYKGQWGYHEACVYIGLAPVLLALASLMLLRKKKIVALFWFITVLSTLLAMGESTAFTGAIFHFFYFHVPGFAHNRSLARIMILPFFAMACVAGITMSEWESFWRKRNLSAWKKNALLWALPLFLLGWTSYDLWKYGHLFIQCQTNPQFYADKSQFYNDSIMEKIWTDPDFVRVQTEGKNAFEVMQHIPQAITNWPITINEVNYCLSKLNENWDTPLADLIRLKYLTNASLAHHPDDRWHVVDGNLVTNTKTLPAAFVVGGYKIQPSPDDAIDAIQAGSLSLREEVFLEKKPLEPIEFQKEDLGAGKILKYDYNQVEIQCQNSSPGILFLSDPYFPGWKAWVDGVEKPILRADGAFRGIVLEKTGNHDIKMVYDPSIISLSFWLSAAGWGLLFFILVFRKSLGAWVALHADWLFLI